MSPIRKYFANAVGSVDYVPNGYIYLHWSGVPLSSLEVRALYTHARNLLSREGLCCILADHRDMPDAPAPADQNWLLQEWLPQTVAQTGYSHCAVLPAPDPAHRLHTPPVVDELRHHLTVMLYQDLDQADAWLQRIR